MTNLDARDLDEFKYTVDTNLEPGYYSSTSLHLPSGRVLEEYKDSRGNLHRWTGPAIHAFNNSINTNEWYIHGKKLRCKTQEEFLK